MLEAQWKSENEHAPIPVVSLSYEIAQTDSCTLYRDSLSLSNIRKRRVPGSTANLFAAKQPTRIPNG